MERLLYLDMLMKEAMISYSYNSSEKNKTKQNFPFLQSSKDTLTPCLYKYFSLSVIEQKFAVV